MRRGARSEKERSRCSATSSSLSPASRLASLYCTEPQCTTTAPLDRRPRPQHSPRRGVSPSSLFPALLTSPRPPRAPGSTHTELSTRHDASSHAFGARHCPADTGPRRALVLISRTGSAPPRPLDVRPAAARRRLRRRQGPRPRARVPQRLDVVQLGRLAAPRLVALDGQQQQQRGRQSDALSCAPRRHDAPHPAASAPRRPRRARRRRVGPRRGVVQPARRRAGPRAAPQRQGPRAAVGRRSVGGVQVAQRAGHGRGRRPRV